MPDYDSQDWERLGRLVRAARTSAGYGDSRAWSARVGRSTRMLLGLERGEPVGDATLARVADALGWPIERVYSTLGGGDTPTHVAAPVLDVEEALAKVTAEIDTLRTLLAAAEASRDVLVGRIEKQRQAARLAREGRSPEVFIAERELRFHQESLAGFDRHFGPPDQQSKDLRRQRRRFERAVGEAQSKLEEIVAQERGPQAVSEL